MEVIHSAVTHHFNPIYSHPQQEIITSLKPVSRGVKGGEEEKTSLSLKPCLWLGTGSTAGRFLLAGLTVKIRKVYIYLQRTKVYSILKLG